MTAEQFLKKYASLTFEQRIAFLAHLAASLTVDARGTYVAGSNSVAKPSRLREFNEFQHRVTFQLLSTLSGNKNRYPDKVFADIMWDFAEAVESRDTLLASLKSASIGLASSRSSVA